MEGHVRSGDIDLWCTDTGGDAPAVVLLHGLGGYAGEWSGTARRLEARYRVVAFDQRGHGRSTRHPEDVSRGAHVDDVAAVAQALGLRRITLIGQSMGGHTALLAAARHPELVGRLVIVESGVGGGGSAATADVAELLRGWQVPFLDRAAASAWFGGGRVGRVWADGLEERGDGLWPAFDADVLIDGVAAVHDVERWTEWESVRQPALLVYGSDGILAAAEINRMAEAQPGARRVIVEGAGHDLHLEAEEVWLEAVTHFLGEST